MAEFFGGLTVLGILLFGDFQGTQVAVGLAAQLLSPVERLRKMADIEVKYGQQKAESIGDVGLCACEITGQTGNMVYIGIMKKPDKQRSEPRQRCSFFGRGRCRD